ncbi:hypothetical protein ACFQLX_01905 [Streptomyces polyrhachis]|uniref:Integral membrane protein n=1 Tax=Streptomyces polyrhachis TaxID=1282885 RepID=A0ABW2GAZ4_9ACTN
MAVCVMVSLVAVTAYTVALGGSGWLWFGWVVLTLCAVGVMVTSKS